MSGEKAKLLCSFGGEFVSQQGRVLYVGGKTRLVSIDRSSSFLSLISKMSGLCDADPSSLDVRFQLTDGSLDSRLVSVESDDDVHNMMEEFDGFRKIPVFLFTDKTQFEEGLAPPEPSPLDSIREPTIETSEEPFEGGYRGPSSHSTLSKRDYTRNPSIRPTMSGEMFIRDSQSLVVGQEYEDVQAFRNALTSAAIASNFELHMIRSDQCRVTARCAAEGCTWRVHASKLPQVRTFRVRSITSDHTCERSKDAGHRQATVKWIASCIREKLRQNQNYKPREILNHIRDEYGVLITYKRAFLGREKALEELRAGLAGGTSLLEDYDPPVGGENRFEALEWCEVDDPPRKRRVSKARQPKEVRPLYCTRCNQIGHNRRTCAAPEMLQS